MWKLLLIPSLAFAQGSSPHLAEVRLSLGVFNLAPHGADVQMQVRKPGGKWLVGVRYAQWTDTFHDPFTGRALTETTERRSGATLDYLFQPERRFTWTVGASILRWTKAEKSLYTGEVGRAATTAPFVGGGFMGLVGSHFTYQVGMYLAPGANMHTHTSVSSEDDSGGFDIRAGFGFRF
jgi:hypothetical protein